MAIDKSQKFITLVRLGYAARGLTYILLGTLTASPLALVALAVSKRTSNA